MQSPPAWIIREVLWAASLVKSKSPFLNLPKNLKVLILCKEQPWECNTFYAQGGIAVAKDINDIPLHIEDTLNAGAGMCDEKAVKTLSEESLEVLEDLICNTSPYDNHIKIKHF